MATATARKTRDDFTTDTAPDGVLCLVPSGEAVRPAARVEAMRYLNNKGRPLRIGANCYEVVMPSPPRVALAAHGEAPSVRIVECEVGVTGDGVRWARRRGGPVDMPPNMEARIAEMCATYGVEVRYDEATNRFEVSSV